MLRKRLKQRAKNMQRTKRIQMRTVFYYFMSLILKNMSFFNLNVMLSKIYFHVINITYIKNYVIFELNITILHVIT